MEEKDIDKLIESFQRANRVLRHRIILMGLFMIITLGLLVIKDKKEDRIERLMAAQHQLEKLRDLPDSLLQKRIEDRPYVNDTLFEALLYADYEPDVFFYKLKQSNYNDKTIIVNLIEDSGKEINEAHRASTVSLFGVSLPLDPWYYLSFLIMLILFHDFTQIMLYRASLMEKLYFQPIEEWKLGFEIFGQYHQSPDPATKFVRLISNTLAGALILCPLITTILLFDVSEGNSWRYPALSILNLVCLCLIASDTLLLLYRENLLWFKDFISIATGANNAPNNRGWRWMIWIVILSYSIIALILIGTVLYELSFLTLAGFLLISCGSFVLLVYSLWKCFKTPENKVWRGIRLASLLMGVFWWVFILKEPSPYIRYNDGMMNDVLAFSIVFALVSSLIAYIYIKYFSEEVVEVDFCLSTTLPLVHILVPAFAGQHEVTIEDSNGQVVYKDTFAGKKDIDVSKFSPGLYSLRVTDFKFRQSKLYKFGMKPPEPSSLRSSSE